ncbi:MAG: COX15/CtaA family protein [Candidatus Cyclobacteriaceae bacterium M2_1C_046]
MIQRKNNNQDKRQVYFHRLALVTLVAIYVLILVGGIVRSTGSGMGCPDWPRCFGKWVPPTDASELPADYEEAYAEKRFQKNIKLAKYLQLLGMEEKAAQVVDEELVKEEQEFNVYKTWIEYLNRVVGVIIGLLVMATFIASIKYYRSEPKFIWVAMAVLFLTVFTGWIGSLVVSTNLLPWMVTVHMLIAFLIVAGMTYLVFASRNKKTDKVLEVPGYTYIVLALSVITLIIQVIYGTQVREAIDEVALSLQYSLRETWISQLDWTFYFHRSFSWLVLFLHVWLLWILIRAGEKFWSVALMALIILSIVTGTLMAYLAIPPVLQPVHLLLAVMVFGFQYYIFLLIRNSVKTEDVTSG